MPVNKRKTPLKSRCGVVSRKSQVVTTTKSRLTQKHFVDVSPVKSLIAGTGSLSASSPQWVAGEIAIFKSPSPRRTRRSSAFHQASTQKRQTISVYKTPATFSFKSPPGVKTRSRRSSVYFMNGETIIEKVVKHSSRQSLSSGKRKGVTQVSNVSKEPEKRLPGHQTNSRSPEKRQTRNTKQMPKSVTPPIKVTRKRKVLGETDCSAKRDKVSTSKKIATIPPDVAQTVEDASSLKRKVGRVVKQSEALSPLLSKTPAKDEKPPSSRKSKKSIKSTSLKRSRPQMCAKDMIALLDDSITTNIKSPMRTRSSGRNVSRKKSSKRATSSVSSPIFEQYLGSSPFPSVKTWMSEQLINSKSPIKTPRRKLSVVLGKDVKTSATPCSTETCVMKVLENKQKSASTPLKEVQISVETSPVKTTKMELSENKKPSASIKEDKISVNPTPIKTRRRKSSYVKIPLSSTPIKKEIEISVEPSPVKTPVIKPLVDKKTHSATPLNEVKITGKLSTPKNSLPKKLLMTKNKRSLSSKKRHSEIMYLSCGDSPLKESAISEKNEKSSTKLKKLGKSLGSLAQESTSLSKVTKSPRKESCKMKAHACSPFINIDKKQTMIALKSFSQITPMSKLIISSPSNCSTPKSSRKQLTLQQQNSAAKKNLIELGESQDASLQYKNKNIEKLKLSPSETLPKRSRLRKSVELETDVARVNTRSEINVPKVNIQSVAALTNRKRKQTATSTVSSSKRRRFDYTKGGPLISSMLTHEKSAMCLTLGAKRNRIDDDDEDGRLSYVRSVSLNSDQEEDDLNQTISKSRSWCSIM